MSKIIWRQTDKGASFGQSREKELKKEESVGANE